LLRQLRLYYTPASARFKEKVLQGYLLQLPDKLIERVKYYIRWQDQQSSIIGKLLLKQALVEFDQNPALINTFRVNKHGKPNIHSPFQFNISHCDGHVICAAGPFEKIGTDIEVFRDINLNSFRGYMNIVQWKKLKTSIHPNKDLLRMWSFNEAIGKAEGSGLLKKRIESIPENKMLLTERNWHFKDIRFIKECAVWIVCNRPIDSILLRTIHFH